MPCPAARFASKGYPARDFGAAPSTSVLCRLGARGTAGGQGHRSRPSQINHKRIALPGIPWRMTAADAQPPNLLQPA
jgi:hypothetical protein